MGIVEIFSIFVIPIIPLYGTISFTGKHTAPDQRALHHQPAVHIQYGVPTVQAIPPREVALADNVHGQR